jgi:hypothetical protein
MALDDKEKHQIAEIVSLVIDSKLTELRKEIIAGFVEIIDWHNDNFAKIMEQSNSKTFAEITKRQREVIELRSQESQTEKAKEAEKSARLGFGRFGKTISKCRSTRGSMLGC